MNNRYTETDMSLELGTEIKKKISKNMDSNKLSTSISNYCNDSVDEILENKSDNTIDKIESSEIISEMRNDMLHMLTIIKSMELQIQDLEKKISPNNSENINNSSNFIVNDEIKKYIDEKITNISNQLNSDQTNFKMTIMQSFRKR